MGGRRRPKKSSSDGASSGFVGAKGEMKMSEMIGKKIIRVQKESMGEKNREKSIRKMEKNYSFDRK